MDLVKIEPGSPSPLFKCPWSQEKVNIAYLEVNQILSDIQCPT